MVDAYVFGRRNSVIDSTNMVACFRTMTYNICIEKQKHDSVVSGGIWVGMFFVICGLKRRCWRNVCALSFFYGLLMRGWAGM